MSTDTFLIVGGGLAAAKAAEALRDGGFEGHLVLVGAERHLPYERPPLSKGCLLGETEPEQTSVHDRPWYEDHQVDLRLGRPVRSLDVEGHTVSLDGADLPYDRLLLATGSTARRLPLADDSGASVAYLRTLEDSARIRGGLVPGRRVGVIGGGWIGLETAAAARNAGCEVVVVESLELPLLGVLGPEVATVFADLHRSHGVDVRTSASVSSIGTASGTTHLRLADGSALGVDLLVVGVGAAPSSELAEACGLSCANGVLVDERLRSSHPDVFAAGDVANAFHPALGRHLRVEHWDNALHQGAVAARNMLGAEEVYDRLPYFFTDQYDLGMEYVGSIGPDGYDAVVLRGDVDARVFQAFWLRGDVVLAAMHANDWDAIDPLRAIVAAGRVDPARLRDERVPLDQVVG